MRWMPVAQNAQLKQAADTNSLNKKMDGTLTGLLVKGKMFNGRVFSI